MRVRVERVGLVAAMVLATLNLFTGGPLLGLWVGSRVVTDGQITMLAVLVIAVVMFAACYGITILLGWLGAKHDELTGTAPTVRRHTPWLRSMSGERSTEHGAKSRLSALEYVLVSAVVAVVVLFEFWFFFKSGSPFDTRSGR